MAPLRRPQQHEKIADHLRKEIHDGTYEPGDTLPSEAELCAQFDSSRGPVRQAMSTLRSEGLISSGRGRRSIVLESGDKYAASFETVLSTSQWLKKLGYEPGQRTEWITRRPADEEIAEKLELDKDDPIVSVERVRLADGKPFMIENVNFRIEAGVHVLGFDTSTGSIHDHMARQGVKFDTIRRSLRLREASEDDAEKLGVAPGSPLLQTLLHVYDHNGVPVEFADYRYLGDVLSLGTTHINGTSIPFWGSLDI